MSPMAKIYVFICLKLVISLDIEKEIKSNCEKAKQTVDAIAFDGNETDLLLLLVHDKVWDFNVKSKNLVGVNNISERWPVELDEGPLKDVDGLTFMNIPTKDGPRHIFITGKRLTSITWGNRLLVDSSAFAAVLDISPGEDQRMTCLSCPCRGDICQCVIVAKGRDKAFFGACEVNEFGTAYGCRKTGELQVPIDIDASFVEKPEKCQGMDYSYNEGNPYFVFANEETMTIIQNDKLVYQESLSTVFECSGSKFVAILLLTGIGTIVLIVVVIAVILVFYTSGKTYDEDFTVDTTTKVQVKQVNRRNK